MAMKLKEKFTTMVLDKDIADWEKVCEKIADDYAIEFADWLIKRQINYFESLTELLKIFKKEKGL
jgi:hypothetical protein